MPIDHRTAESFIWSVDRHRYSMLFGDGAAGPVVEALCGYRNADGGFGHALEPDLRCPGSQPAPTLYALEILGEAGAADGALARDARAFIARVAAPDGGIPSVLPGFEVPARVAGHVASPTRTNRSSPRRRRVRAAAGRRPDVRLAGLVAGADDRLARQRHPSRVDLAA